MDKVQLLSRGPSSCWPGHYHYLEPWLGCDNNCYFCFARCRNAVRETAKLTGSKYSKPTMLFDRASLLKQLEKEINSTEIKMIRPCRFTDFLSNSFVENGLAYDILKLMCESEKVPAIAISSKGVPDSKLIKLMIKHKDKVRFYSNIRPDTGKFLEPDSLPYDDRIDAVSLLALNGVKTAVHIDPLIPGIDEPEDVEVLLEKLKGKGLDRVMFSFLMMNQELIDFMKTKLDDTIMSKILSVFDFDKSKTILVKGQEDTGYVFIKDHIREEYTKQIVKLLKKHSFDFVLCPSKNLEVGKRIHLPDRNVSCWKGFYS